jgi:hypothetical protein
VAHGSQHLQVVAAVAESERVRGVDAVLPADVPDDLPLSACARKEVDVVAVRWIPGRGIAAAHVHPQRTARGRFPDGGQVPGIGLLDDEAELVSGKRGATRLGFALLLKYVQYLRVRSGPLEAEQP